MEVLITLERLISVVSIALMQLNQKFHKIKLSEALNIGNLFPNEFIMLL